MCYRSHSRFNTKHCPHIDPSCTTPTEGFTTIGYQLWYPVLQFWTLTAHFKISETVCSPYGIEVGERGTIVDCDQNLCGSVHLHGGYDTDNIETFEFLVLSECRYSMGGSAIEDRDEWLPEMKAHPQRWDLYWVMLIEWDGKGNLAERRGIGQIYQKLIETSFPPGPSWKKIVLG